MAILKANGKILKANGKVLVKSEGVDIPLIGTLAHQWDLNANNPDISLDKVGGVRFSSLDSLSFGSHGFLNVGSTHGVSLKAKINVYDYIECIFYLGRREDTVHIRPLNKTGGPVINDRYAFVIWRGVYDYWTSYMTEWITPALSSNFDLFNGKKIGLYLKPNGYADIYVDNILIAQNRYIHWDADLASIYYYALGVTVTNYTSSTSVECERVRIYRDCHY